MISLFYRITFFAIVSLFGCSGSMDVNVSSIPKPITYKYQISDSVWRSDTTSHLPPNIIAPVAIKKIAPVFPQLAIRPKIQGWALICVLINTEGKVDRAIVAATDPETFMIPSLEAAEKWMFTPSLKDGQPEPIWAYLEFHFLFIDGKPVVIMPQ